MNQRYMNDSIICYLTPKAQDVVRSFVTLYNMDFDLAIEVANLIMKEEDLWELPEIEDL